MSANEPAGRGWRRWQGQGLKTRLLHPWDELWDRRLGIRTVGYRPAVGEPEDESWQGHYQPTSYADLQRMLRHVDIGPDDVYVDLGCGLGRTVFAARASGVRRAVGVEVDPALVRACRDNLARTRLDRTGIEFVEGYAQDYAHTDTTVLFLFHPFGRGTLRSVLDGLREDLGRRPRHLRLVYFNAVSDDVLAASGFLSLRDRWEPGSDWRPTSGAYPASFWESRAAS